MPALRLTPETIDCRAGETQESSSQPSSVKGPEQEAGERREFRIGALGQQDGGAIDKGGDREVDLLAPRERDGRGLAPQVDPARATEDASPRAQGT